MADHSFDAAYVAGTPPWDIGRAQPVVIRLRQAGMIVGSVLDVGCGTGENALFLAEAGHDVVGVDAAPTAIARARRKAGGRGVRAEFLEWDALDLGSLGRAFDTVIDSGLFHVFSDEERPAFVRGLASVVRPAGTYLMLCFSEREPPGWGPRRVTQEEIREAFADGWRVEAIHGAAFDTVLEARPRVEAWLSHIIRL